jgi:hypothetical protein
MRSRRGKRTIVLFIAWISLFAFLSFGPTNDVFRADPDIVEPGSLQASTRSFTTYQTLYHPFSELYSPSIVTPVSNHFYVIETAEDLYRFSMLCYDETWGPTFLGLNYVLGDDIDYSSNYGSAKFFRPVGFRPNLPFVGSFDGQGFEISNLFFEPISADTSISIYGRLLTHIAMFSVLGAAGTVQNIGFINPSFNQVLDYDNIKNASVAVGVNYGNLHHVYLVDNRTTAEAGLKVNGNFRLAGLVVHNYGSVTDVFVAVPRIKHAAVSINTSVSILCYYNEPGATLSKANYDKSIYTIDAYDELSELGTALLTSAFQTPANFTLSSGWFFNSSYSINPNFVYPLLKGIRRVGLEYNIYTAADLVYLSELIDMGIGFQTQTYYLSADIDMSTVSRTAYKPPLTTYTGTFRGRTTNYEESGLNNNRLYVRVIGSGDDYILGDNTYFTILNLSLNRATDYGIFAGYGLFGILQGTVRDLNILGVTLRLDNHFGFTTEDYVSAGVVASRLSGGTVNNVDVDVISTVPSGTMNRLFLGGMIGHGNGTITLSSSQGNIYGGTQVFHTKSKDTAFGGLAGYAGIPGATSTLIVTTNVNYIDIVGPGFGAGADSLVSIGGLIGSGYLNYINNVVNNGNITSQSSDSESAAVFMGGIIGYQTYLASNSTTLNNTITNNGKITLVVNGPALARIGAGYGVAANTYSQSGRIYNTVKNSDTGKIILEVPNPASISPAELALMDIQMAGILITYFLGGATFNDATNEADFDVDLSYVQQFAGILLANMNDATGIFGDFRFRYDNKSTPYAVNTTTGATTTLFRALNKGDITATTSRPVLHPQLKLSGVSLGKGIHITNSRNEGNISVSILHDASSELLSSPPTDGIALQQKNIIITGVMEEAYAGKRAIGLYNGGHLSFYNDPTKDVKFNVTVSGILHRNRNVTTDSANTYIVNNLLNDGYITIDAAVTGNVRASGIVGITTGTLHSAINAGDIYAKNAIKENTSGIAANDFLVDAAGISALLTSTSNTGRIQNAVNYGDVVAHATTDTGTSTSNGRATAAGILARNNRKEDQTIVASSSDTLHNGWIRHAVNYGSIYAWNDRTDSTGVRSEVFSIAGGILGVGLLRIDTTINYGDVYSKTLAGGIVGHLDLYGFARYLNPTSVYLANLINYGQIRRITASTAFSFAPATIGISQNPAYITTTVSNNQAHGAIIGNIYIATIETNFAVSNNYLLAGTKYRQWLNFDSESNILGVMPTVASENSALNTTLSALAYTTKADDQSGYPYGNVATYDLTSEATGVFYEHFPFMEPDAIVPVLGNYIGFIPTNRVNHYLLEKIGFEFTPDDIDLGIFALGTSVGIGEQGLYLPDQFNLDLLNPLSGDVTWRSVTVSGGESLNEKITKGMKQLSESLATNIDNIQLVDNLLSPSLRLLNPVIDNVNNIISFYVANNSIYAQDPGRSYNNDVVAYAPTVGIGTHIWNGTAWELSGSGTHNQVFVTTINPDTPLSFYVNTVESATYLLGYRASFWSDDGASSEINTASTILNSFGREGEFLGVDGLPLNPYTEHQGIIRVYSEAYDVIEQDSFTYRDYKIRIIRLEDSTFTDVTALNMDGTAYAPTYTDVHDYDATALPPINFKPLGSLGRFVLTYATENVAFMAVPHSSIQLIGLNAVLDPLDDTIMATNLYSITSINRQVTTGLDLITNTWNPSTMEYTFTVTQALPSGTYKLRINFLDGTTYDFQFVKMQSTEASIISISANNTAVPFTNGVYVSYVSYGLYYNPLDATTTRAVNFTNLLAISEVTAAMIISTPLTSRPSHLTAMTISNFAILVSVELSVSEPEVLGDPHVYTVIYNLRSETGLEISYTHTIIERTISPDISAVFLGVNPLAAPYADQSFQREETPSYKIDYALTNLYRPQTSWFSAAFVSPPGDPATPETDYLLTLLNTGFQLSFYSSAPSGQYSVTYAYNNSTVLSGVDNPLAGIEMAWGLTFETVNFHKIKSSLSHLTNITFTSEAAFSGMATIINTTYVDETLYESLFNNSGLREIQIVNDQIFYNGFDLIPGTQFYVIGLVANTDLSYYNPDFFEPGGARVVRIYGEGLETDILSTDFTPLDETSFNFIHYRVYAEDWEAENLETSDHFTDYYVAVSDTTNNVYLTINIHMAATDPLTLVYLSFLLNRTDGTQAIISLYSQFIENSTLGTDYPLRAVSSGLFELFPDLPLGYAVTVAFEGVIQSNNTFLIPESVIAHRYTIDITIIDAASNPDAWGQRVIKPFRP